MIRSISTENPLRAAYRPGGAFGADVDLLAGMQLHLVW